MNNETKHAPELLLALLWYQTRSNNGRGRITGNAAKLLKAGLLRREQTSYYGWCLSLSDSGRSALAKVQS